MTRFIWFNKLLRHAYRNLPLPWHIKQRAKAIYLGLPVTWKIRNRNTLFIDKNREPLSLLAACARQFDPADPWALVFDSEVPAPDPAFSSVRMTMILGALAEMGFQVAFIPSRGPCSHDYETLLKIGGISVLSDFKAVQRHLAAEGGKYHFVLLSGPEVAFAYLPYIRAYALYSRVVYDSLHWPRIERDTGISNDSAATARDESFRPIELFNAASADLILVTAEEEKNRLLMEQPDANVRVLPDPYEIEPPETPYMRRTGLLFIGDFRSKSDEDAVIYFVNDILPRILEKFADLVFYIAGNNTPASIEALRSGNVKPLGLIRDAAQYFESCRIYIAPLRFGVTTRRMVGQSLAHGLPVVATPIGAQSMDMENERHLLIANDADEFANAVIRLYNDEVLWQRLSAAALDHLQDRYSYTAARKRTCAIFDSVLEGESAIVNSQNDGTSTSSGRMASTGLLKSTPSRYLDRH